MDSFAFGVLFGHEPYSQLIRLCVKARAKSRVVLVHLGTIQQRSGSGPTSIYVCRPFLQLWQRHLSYQLIVERCRLIADPLGSKSSCPQLPSRANARRRLGGLIFYTLMRGVKEARILLNSISCSEGGSPARLPTFLIVKCRLASFVFKDSRNC